MTPETHKGLFNPLSVSDDTEYAHFIGNGPFASQGNWGEDQGHTDFFKLPTTKHKMAATTKKEGIRKRRFAQISSKHALSTPYSLQW